MKIQRLPRQTHGTREYAHAVASGSVNTDAPNLGLEILKVVERQLAPYGFEIVVFDNGPDALIWRFIGKHVERRRLHAPQPPVSVEVTSHEVAVLAGTILRMEDDEMRAAMSSSEFIKSIRSIAASALTQREKEIVNVEQEHRIEEGTGELGTPLGTVTDGSSTRMGRYRG